MAVNLEAVRFTRHGFVAGKIHRAGSNAVEDERLGESDEHGLTLEGAFLWPGI